METISEQACFGGTQGFYSHLSSVTGTTMRFAVFQPQQARGMKLPVLYYLAGLTCTEETATIKAGAQRLASEFGIMLVMPDTSPRDVGLPGEEDDWDFGTGAGFYLDAVMEPWAGSYRMYNYIRDELRLLINENFNADIDLTGIFGHSMGGHGALTIALKNPDIYKSVSAFAPISAPMQCPWGQKAFTGYLGTDEASWIEYDAAELVKNGHKTSHILIDQGKADQFLTEQLKPEIFEAACKEAGQPLTTRLHENYDHSYYFIQTFMEDHIRHHVSILKQS